MRPSSMAFTPIERIAIDTIREERPEVVARLSDGLAALLEDLALTSQGRVVSEAAIDDLLRRLREAFVIRMMAELEPWGEDEDLRESVVDVLTRHLLAEARAGFVPRVVVAKRN